MQSEKINRYSLRKFGQHFVSAVVAVVVVGILSSGMAISQATLAHADTVGKDNDLRNGSESSRTAGSANKTNLTKDEEGYYDLMTEKTSENLYPEVFQMKNCKKLKQKNTIK